MTGVSIVCMGDSITAGAGGTVTYETYLGQLMTWATITNKGTSGNTTAQMLARFTTDVIDLAPQYVVILGGINDINAHTAAATIEGNLEDMYEAAIAADITPILCTVMPDHAYDSGHDSDITTLNTWITNYATTNSLTCVDLYTVMQDPSFNTYLKPSYTDDGLHPNNNGYLQMATAVFNKVFLPGILSAYKYRATFDVTDASSNPAYQTQLSLSWLTGMAADFTDLAFTDSSGNGIPWGIMPGSTVSGTSCTVWLALPASETTVYCYYGTSGAPNLGNLAAVFEQWDDFLSSTLDTSRWSEYAGSGSERSISGGIITLTGGTGGRNLDSIATWGGGYAVIVRANLGSTNYNMLGWLYNHAEWIAHMYAYPTASVANSTIRNAVPTTVNNNEGAQSGYKVYEIKRPVTGDVIFLIDGAGSNTLSNIYTASIPATLYAAAGATVLADYFAIRKYTPTEPSIAYSSTGDNPSYDSQETILESSIDRSTAVALSLDVTVTFKSTATEPAVVNILTSCNGTDWTTAPELQYEHQYDIPVSAGSTVRSAFLYQGAAKYIRAVLVDDLINPGVDSASSDYFLQVFS